MPRHDGMFFQAHQFAQLQENGAQDKHVDLEHVRKIQ